MHDRGMTTSAPIHPPIRLDNLQPQAPSGPPPLPPSAARPLPRESAAALILEPEPDRPGLGSRYSHWFEDEVSVSDIIADTLDAAGDSAELEEMQRQNLLAERQRVLERLRRQEEAARQEELARRVQREERRRAHAEARRQSLLLEAFPELATDERESPADDGGLPLPAAPPPMPTTPAVARPASLPKTTAPRTIEPAPSSILHEHKLPLALAGGALVVAAVGLCVIGAVLLSAPDTPQQQMVHRVTLVPTVIDNTIAHGSFVASTGAKRTRTVRSVASRRTVNARPDRGMTTAPDTKRRFDFSEPTAGSSGIVF